MKRQRADGMDGGDLPHDAQADVTPVGKRPIDARRRRLLAGLAGTLAASAHAADRPRDTAAAPDPVAPAEPPFDEPVRGAALAFPRDHGAHPGFRTEWWYLTGWLDAADAAAPLGFQITFFRSRLAVGASAASRFAPRQIVFAHVALSDPALGHALHDDRALRAGFSDVAASVGDASLALRDWRLARDAATDRWQARLAARDFTLALDFTPTQPPMLQGDAGWSQKSAPVPGRPVSASHYYSLPALGVAGSVTRDGHERRVTGRAWLDHEWSSQYLAPDAAGWDWTAINFDDGSALMAFRMRRKGAADDAPALWAHAGYRAVNAGATTDPGTPRFTPLRVWTSPRTGARYPVAMTLDIGTRRLTLEPLMNDQELDSRRSTGVVYWEGAVRALEGGKRVGLGYLELTGYTGALKL